jgi:hypothetical protein
MSNNAMLLALTMAISLALISCNPPSPKKVPIYMFGIAQGEFRTNDPDGNGKHDYWRRDIRGLYALKSPQGSPLQLIPKDAALADARPSPEHSTLGKSAPWYGYWYCAIRNEDEVDLADPYRFAICCYPDQYEPGRRTYIINENGSVYSKDLGKAGGVETFPTAPLSDGWSREN